jgi:WXG100 family type VII secretion target
MANRLKVSTKELEDASNEYRKCNADMMNICAQVTAIVHRVNGSWKGKASNSFFDKFSRMDQELKQTNDKTNDAVDELREAAGIFESAENTNIKITSALQVGVSPFN